MSLIRFVIGELLLEVGGRVGHGLVLASLAAPAPRTPLRATHKLCPRNAEDMHEYRACDVVESRACAGR